MRMGSAVASRGRDSSGGPSREGGLSKRGEEKIGGARNRDQSKFSNPDEGVQNRKEKGLATTKQREGNSAVRPLKKDKDDLK